MPDETDIHGRLIRIEEKLDAALGRLDDHEARIRKSEYTMWTGYGVVAAAAAFMYKIGFH